LHEDRDRDGKLWHQRFPYIWGEGQTGQVKQPTEPATMGNSCTMASGHRIYRI